MLPKNIQMVIKSRYYAVIRYVPVCLDAVILSRHLINKDYHSEKISFITHDAFGILLGAVVWWFLGLKNRKVFSQFFVINFL